MMRSALTQVEKTTLAMSRAQYEEHRATESPRQRGEEKADANDLGICLNVGVSILRLDQATAQPAILLLRRRKPFVWWDDESMFISTSETRQQVGDWELPGGTVLHDDLSISSAIERTVRNQTGLRVVKIMQMLRAAEWEMEVKAISWDDEDGYYSSDETESDEHEDNDSEVEESSRGGVGGIEHGWHGNMARRIGSGGWSIAGEEAQMIDGHNSDDMSSYDEMVRRFLQDDLETFEIPERTPPPTGGANTANPTLDTAPNSDGDGHHLIDPSLQPAPLSLPSRPMNVHTTPDQLPSLGRLVQFLRMSDSLEYNKEEYPSGEDLSSISTLSLPSVRSQSHHQAHQAQPQARARRGPPRRRGTLRRRRRGQVFEHRILSGLYRQLNVAVLVDENATELAAPRNILRGRPPFPGLASDSEHAGSQTDSASSIHQPAGYGWVTLEQAHKLNLREDVRCLVYQTFAWFDNLNGDFI
ncbi:hypothetical protein F5Y17DRAFT_354434 [Xylariaceae sp. FL0594]|nr:hypothetical protein F5Y17DRAFT_354434 [Xylariaceae sp. FL0594]